MKFKSLSFRKTLCTLLSAAMVMTSFTVPVFAENEDVFEEAMTEDAVEEVYANQAAEDVATETVQVAENESVDGFEHTVSEGSVPTGSYTYDSTRKEVNAEFVKSRKIKITWKVKGAAKADIVKVTDLGVFTICTKDNAYDADYKKNYFNDVEADGGVYFVKLYDRFGSPLGSYITSPSTYLMRARSTIDGNVELSFPALPETCTYTIYKSANAQFKSSVETIATDLTGADLIYSAQGIGNVPTYTYVDKGAGVAGYGLVKKKHFYRIQVNTKYTVDGTEYNMQSKISGSVGAYGVRFAAPVITAMNGVTGHEDGCYAGAQIKFVVPEAGWFNDKYLNAKTTYEIYKTLNGNAYGLVTTVKGTNLQTEESLDTPDKKVYVINVSNLQPEQNYSYVIRAINGTQKSEYSNAFPYYFHFKDVVGLSTASAGDKKVDVKWKSEQCAQTYNVYRTINGYSTQEEADKVIEEASLILGANYQKAPKAKLLKALGIKKAKTVTNNTPISGQEIVTTISNLTPKMCYGFYVVPVNAGRYGFDDGAITTADVVISSPSSINLSNKGLAGYKLAWPKVTNANSYLLERVQVSENVVVARLKGSEDWENDSRFFDYHAWECSLAEKNVYVTEGNPDAKTGAARGVTYLYRVRAIYTDRDGKQAVTAPRDYKFKEAVIGPKKVTNLSTHMVVRDTYWDNNVNSRLTLSGNKVGAGGVKVTFTVNDSKNTAKYEIQRTDDEGKTWINLPTMTPGTKNKADTYTSKSKTISFYDDGRARGQMYTYRIRPVSADGTTGMWQTAEFGVASSIFVYYQKNPNMNSDTCLSKAKACPVSAGSTFRVYIDFFPERATVTDINVGDTGAYELVEQGWEYNNEDTDEDDLYYVELKATSTVDKSDSVSFKYKYGFDKYDTSRVVKNAVMYFKTK